MTVVQDNNVFKDFLLWYHASFSCDIASSFRFTQDVRIRHGLCKEQSRDYILGILYIEHVCRHTGLVELDTLGQPWLLMLFRKAINLTNRGQSQIQSGISLVTISKPSQRHSWRQPAALISGPYSRAFKVGLIGLLDLTLVTLVSSGQSHGCYKKLINIPLYAKPGSQACYFSEHHHSLHWIKALQNSELSWSPYQYLSTGGSVMEPVRLRRSPLLSIQSKLWVVFITRHSSCSKNLYMKF